MAWVSLEGPSMFVLFTVLSAIFLQQDDAYFSTNDDGDFKQIMDILSKPRTLDRAKDEQVPLKEPAVKKFSWHSCGGAGDVFVLKQLIVGPDPLHVPGNVSIAFHASLAVPLHAPVKMALEVKKKIVLWIPIPCVDDVGSCTYDNVCDIISQLPCPPAFKQHGIPCQCPVKAGSYNLPLSKVPVQGERMPHWLTEGDYKVTVRLQYKGAELACIDSEFSLSG